MSPGLTRALIILPGTVAVLVPGLLLWKFHAGLAPAFTDVIGRGPAHPSFWGGLLLIMAGGGLGAWATSLFTRFGDGTPAPWEPPQNLVVRGPYRHVRNPMITGVITLLAGEALLFQSLPIAAWMLLFFAGNAVYFPLVEEKGLINRFGQDYLLYKENVPRWLPRLRPWSLPD